MTVGKLIETVTVLIGQQYDLEMMIGWLNEIEGQVLDQVVNRSQGYDIEFKSFTDEDMERELAVPDRFQDVYINYLRAKVDIANQERSATTMTLPCLTRRGRNMQPGISGRIFRNRHQNSEIIEVEHEIALFKNNAAAGG